MKKHFVTTASLITLFIIVLTLDSCKTSSFSKTFLVPADITIPQHIKSVGILNRSLPDKQGLIMNILEGFITGESIMADRESSLSALRGAINTLNINPRFKAVSMEGEDYRGTGTKQFPIPLDWNIVDQLCKKYNVDAIVSLETFDSDIMISRDTKEQTGKKEGRDVKYLEYFANLNIRASAGWRFYDNVKKQLIDEQVFVDEKGFSGRGLSPEEALSKLPPKRRALDDAGMFAGEMLAFRISPKWLNASRYYYTKARKEEIFKYAKRYVKSEQWKTAADTWLPLTNSTDNTIAGRACHNMAVAEEMQGNLKEAIKWANEAYVKHNLKRSRSYLNELNRRQMDQSRLKEQMEGKEEGKESGKEGGNGTGNGAGNGSGVGRRK